MLLVLKSVFSSSKESKHVQAVKCYACGWKGQVSRYVGRCPKCNMFLEQVPADEHADPEHAEHGP